MISGCNTIANIDSTSQYRAISQYRQAIPVYATYTNRTMLSDRISVLRRVRFASATLARLARSYLRFLYGHAKKKLERAERIRRPRDTERARTRTRRICNPYVRIHAQLRVHGGPLRLYLQFAYVRAYIDGEYEDVRVNTNTGASARARARVTRMYVRAGCRRILVY